MPSCLIKKWPKSPNTLQRFGYLSLLSVTKTTTDPNIDSISGLGLNKELLIGRALQTSITCSCLVIKERSRSMTLYQCLLRLGISMAHRSIFALRSKNGLQKLFKYQYMKLRNLEIWYNLGAMITGSWFERFIHSAVDISLFSLSTPKNKHKTRYDLHIYENNKQPCHNSHQKMISSSLQTAFMPTSILQAQIAPNYDPKSNIFLAIFDLPERSITSFTSGGTGETCVLFIKGWTLKLLL